MDTFRNWYFGRDQAVPGVAWLIILSLTGLPLAAALGLPIVGWPIYEITMGLCAMVVLLGAMLARR